MRKKLNRSNTIVKNEMHSIKHFYWGQYHFKRTESDTGREQWTVKTTLLQFPSDSRFYAEQSWSSSGSRVWRKAYVQYLDRNDFPVLRGNTACKHVMAQTSTSFFSTTSQATCKPSSPLKGISRVSISQSTCCKNQDPRSAK